MKAKRPKQFRLSDPIQGGLKNLSSAANGQSQQTDFGRIPNEWSIATIGELFETQLGKMLSQKAHGGDSPKPYLRNKNVQWGRIDTDDLLTMDFSDREKTKFLLRKGDLLLCEGGVPGRGAIWNGQIAECYYQKALHRLRPRNDTITNEFMLNWLRFSMELQNLYGVSGASSTIAHLPETQLKALSVPVPPLAEQNKIATVLGVMQRAMEHQESLLSLTTELKKTLLYQLFTRGFRHEPQKHTAIGPVPKSWEVVPLTEVLAEELQNGAFARREQFGSGLLFANVVDMYRETHLNPAQLERVRFELSLVKQYLLRKGDVLVVRSSLKREGIGQNCVVGDFSEPAIYDCHLIRAVPNQAKIIPEFLSYYWRSPVGKLDLIQRSKTVTMTTINQAGISGALVPIPSLDEQRDIVALIAQVEFKARVHTRKHGTLAALFRTLLYQLMTGTIRVCDLDLSKLESAIAA